MEPPINFCQLSMRLRNLPSNTVHFPCGHWAICEFSLTLCAATGPPINFSPIPSTYRDAVESSVNFCQLFMQPRDLTSTSVNFQAAARPPINFQQLSAQLCDLHVYFHQLSMLPCDPPSTFVNFPCCCVTLHQHLSTFCSATGPSINFRHIHGIFVHFRCIDETFWQLLWRRKVLHLLSTSTASVRPSTHF